MKNIPERRYAGHHFNYHRFYGLPTPINYTMRTQSGAHKAYDFISLGPTVDLAASWW